MDLILASTSPYRRQLLEARHIPFRAMAPLCDEDSYKNQGLGALELTQKLAQIKAESLIPQCPRSLILGSDQVLEWKGQIFGKPKTPAKALEQLECLQGETHQLITSMHLWSPTQTWTHTECVQLTMHPWSRKELERYIERDQPLDCAGSYKLEKGGLVLFEKIEASDYESIIGLPLLKLFSILKQVGFPLL